MNKNLRHDFINNSLNLEVLTKLICEDLQNNTSLKEEYLNDLIEFLEKQLEFSKEILENLKN